MRASSSCNPVFFFFFLFLLLFFFSCLSLCVYLLLILCLFSLCVCIFFRCISSSSFVFFPFLIFLFLLLLCSSKSVWLRFDFVVVSSSAVVRPSPLLPVVGSLTIPVAVWSSIGLFWPVVRPVASAAPAATRPLCHRFCRFNTVRIVRLLRSVPHGFPLLSGLSCHPAHPLFIAVSIAVLHPTIRLVVRLLCVSIHPMSVLRRFSVPLSLFRSSSWVATPATIWLPQPLRPMSRYFGRCADILADFWPSLSISPSYVYGDISLSF